MPITCRGNFKAINCVTPCRPNVHFFCTVYTKRFIAKTPKFCCAFVWSLPVGRCLIAEQEPDHLPVTVQRGVVQRRVAVRISRPNAALTAASQAGKRSGPLGLSTAQNAVHGRIVTGPGRLNQLLVPTHDKPCPLAPLTCPPVYTGTAHMFACPQAPLTCPLVHWHRSHVRLSTGTAHMSACPLAPLTCPLSVHSL